MQTRKHKAVYAVTLAFLPALFSGCTDRAGAPATVAISGEEQLQHWSKVAPGRIGVSIQQVNHTLAQSFQLTKPAGALVSSVADDSPAARAGIRAGDIILAFNGKPVGDSSNLPLLVGELTPGQKANVRVWRNGGERGLTVTIGAMPDERVAAEDTAGTGQPARR